MILPDGQHGYILGNTNIYQIKKVVLLQKEVEVHEHPSVQSIVKNQYKKGAEFYLTSLVTKDGKNWIKIRDISGTKGS